MSNQIDSRRGQPIIRETGNGPVHDVLGVTHIYKALAHETGGLVSVWETVVPQGAGAPPHSHAGEDEAFYVLDGELTMEVAGETRPIVLGAGSFVYSPRGVEHAFRNCGAGPLLMLVLCLPGGIERMFATMDAATRSQKTPDPAEIVALAAAHGVSIASAA
jgi:mannose-6-phosphate isomerase-like protein (cupin superfamily)